jgi:hypothetical protein
VPCSIYPVVEQTIEAQAGSPAEPSASFDIKPAEPSKYVRPRNEAAIRQLSDADLDKLTEAALEERARRKKPEVFKQSHRKRVAEEPSAGLPLGKLNAVWPTCGREFRLCWRLSEFSRMFCRLCLRAQNSVSRKRRLRFEETWFECCCPAHSGLKQDIARCRLMTLAV